MTARALGDAVAAAVIIAGGLAVATPCAAQPAPATQPAAAPRPLGTDPGKTEEFAWRYPTFRTSEYVATGIFVGLAIGGQLLPTAEGRWTGENDVDGAFRDALRIDSHDGRKTADDASDLTLTLLLNHAAFDAVGVAWWGRGKGSVAYQMIAIDAEALALTAALAAVSKGVAARERPYVAECTSNATFAGSDECDSDDRHRSFISGHASTAFTAASVTCMHHAYLALYDHPVADTAACVAAYGVASATSVLRVVSDNHHVSDVVAGAAVGTLVGLGVPWLLHYRHPLEITTSSPTGDVSVRIVPGPTSATLLGTF